VRARESFLASGGEELTLIPCTNAHPTWVRAVVDIARESSAWLAPPARAQETAA
jgi:ferrochelatase